MGWNKNSSMKQQKGKKIKHNNSNNNESIYKGRGTQGSISPHSNTDLQPVSKKLFPQAVIVNSRPQLSPKPAPISPIPPSTPNEFSLNIVQQWLPN